MEKQLSQIWNPQAHKSFTMYPETCPIMAREFQAIIESVWILESKATTENDVESLSLLNELKVTINNAEKVDIELRSELRKMHIRALMEAEMYRNLSSGKSEIELNNIETLGRLAKAQLDNKLLKAELLKSQSENTRLQFSLKALEIEKKMSKHYEPVPCG